MTVKLWLEQAIHDAERRGLPALKPLLDRISAFFLDPQIRYARAV